MWMIFFEGFLEIHKMKKEQKPTPDLRELLGMKEPSDRGGKKKPILKKTHFTIWYFVIAFMIILLIQNYIVTKKTEDVIPYSEFKEALRTGKIKDLTITQESISGERETDKGSRRFTDGPCGGCGSGEGIRDLSREIHRQGRQ